MASWTLAAAVDALADSARSTGKPGWIWLAGIGYPSIGLGLGAGWTGGWLGEKARGEGLLGNLGGGISGIEGMMELVVTHTIWMLPILMVVLRLRVGLARIAPPLIWNQLSEIFGKPKLRQAWRAGKGLTWSTLGMSLMLTLMMGAAVALIAIPVQLLYREALGNLADPALPLAGLFLLVPPIVVLATYAILLSILHQLALQSLAHNRRGVSSALVHAWRIAKENPGATGRTVVVDLLLNLTIIALSVASMLILQLTFLDDLAIVLVHLPLLGFMGVTRACFWARAYRALGGLSPDDQVPGLSEEALPLG